MKIAAEFNYRHAKELLTTLNPELLAEISHILNSASNKIDLTIKEDGNSPRKLSSQIQLWFTQNGYKSEHPCFSNSIKDLRYDLAKDNIPIEIEIGHERLVYADFFKFLTDYTNNSIPLGIMIVAATPKKFGHTWHNSIESTKKKILAVQGTYLVPILVIGIDP